MSSFDKKEYLKKYYIKNREQIIHRQKQHYESHGPCKASITKSKEYNDRYYAKIKLIKPWRNIKKHYPLRPSQKWRLSPEYQAWRDAVLDKHNSTCQKCKATKCVLHCHHIKKAKDHPDLKYDVDNGIVLCEHCHKLEHQS